jgi:biopolymer transport protein ExbB
MEVSMFEGKSIFQIFAMGGFVMWILLLCSILSIAVIIERFFIYRQKSKITRDEFMKTIREKIKGNDITGALEIAWNTKTPFAKVVSTGLKLKGRSEKEISNEMERAITVETLILEQFTGIVGTIGNVAVYIGLFGTVIGIMRAFHEISVAGAGGMNIVIRGISEALIATATGLLVAVPAVVAYNYFVRRIDNFVADMEVCASEIIDLIAK